jgi:hypothetical protein
MQDQFQLTADVIGVGRHCMDNLSLHSWLADRSIAFAGAGVLVQAGWQAGEPKGEVFDDYIGNR